MEPVPVRTDKQTADMLTKSLFAPAFRRHRDELMGTDEDQRHFQQDVGNLLEDTGRAASATGHHSAGIATRRR